jgi:hypothetical protein
MGVVVAGAGVIIFILIVVPDSTRFDEEEIGFTAFMLLYI